MSVQDHGRTPTYRTCGPMASVLVQGLHPELLFPAGLLGVQPVHAPGAACVGGQRSAAAVFRLSGVSE